MTTPTVLHRIGGKPTEGSPETFGDVTDPATGAVSARVAYASAHDIDAAVTTAAAAFADWRDVSLAKRAAVMFRFRDRVERHRDDVARAIGAEHGKTFEDARAEVQRGLEVVEFACGLPHLLKGEYAENVSTAVDAYSIRQPLGVVAGITPFNFPAMVPMWMFPVAVACGNTFILKPSEKVPSASTLLAELFTDAGLPDGVFNVVHGGKTAVDALLDHPGVSAVSFVGSTPIARYVYERGTAAGKRVQALGGAKNHMVVMPDADLATAADAAVSAGYGAAGERCMAISVVVAVGGVGDALVEAIADRARKLHVGPTDDPAAQMGPLITAAHRDKVAGYVDAGVAEGAELVVDGRPLAVEGHESGNFLGPCLFDRVTPEMTIYREEIFGPVLSVVRADDYGQALDLINANPYGNGTALFTANGGLARSFCHDVQVGMVGVNVPIPTPMAYFSFGGWKQSLFGDSHVHGMHGVHFYTHTKAITARWPQPESTPTGLELHFPTAN